jgi:hypothetical protein
MGNLTEMSTCSNFCMGNLTKISIHSNFHVGNLTKVSTCLNFCMDNLIKVFICLNFCIIAHLNFYVSNSTICPNFCMSNNLTNVLSFHMTEVSTHLKFHTSNLTKVFICSNFLMGNLAIQSHSTKHNKSNLLTDYVPLSHGCHNPHLTLLMLPFCTEQADFMQSIYHIYGFITGHKVYTKI